MKRTLFLPFLLMALLIASCSSEDNEPQSVSMTAEQTAIHYLGTILKVNVTSNCEWTISATGCESIEPAAGSGNMTVNISYGRNTDYYPKETTISLTSEDKTSSASITLTQEAEEVLNAKGPGMLQAEGGEFEIKAETNMDNPEMSVNAHWITLVKSRSLQGKTWVFKAEPNKTGSPRKADVLFKLSGHNEVVTVKQDSYAPEAVTVTGLDETCYVDQETTIGISLEPEYADWEKLVISLKNEDGSCAYTLSDSILTFVPEKQRPYTLSVSSGSSTLFSGSTYAINEKVELWISPAKDLIVGEEFTVSTNLPEKYVSTKIVSGKDLVEETGDNRYKVLSTGDVVIHATNLVSKKKDSKAVKVVPARMKLWVGSQESSEVEGKALVKFKAEVVSGGKITVRHFYIYDSEGTCLLNTSGYLNFHGNSFSIETFELLVDLNGVYRMVVDMSVDGEDVVLTEKVAVR